MKASILYYFLPPPTFIAPRMIEFHSPAFPAGQASSLNPPPSPQHEFSWFLCASAKSHDKFCDISFSVIRWLKQCNSILPCCCGPARCLPRQYPNDASPHSAEVIDILGPIALSIFILLLLNLPHKPVSKRPPPHYARLHLLSNAPPPPTPSFV
jgi:hypothetical protein